MDIRKREYLVLTCSFLPMRLALSIVILLVKIPGYH